MRFNLLKTSLSSDSVLCVSVESLSVKKSPGLPEPLPCLCHSESNNL